MSNQHESPIEHEKLEVLREIAKTLKHIMIIQSTFDSSLAALTTAVTNAAAALAAGNTATSTPDATVQTYLAGVAAQTVALAGATPPAAVPPPVVAP